MPTPSPQPVTASPLVMSRDPETNQPLFQQPSHTDAPADPLTHGMNCPALTPGNDEDCTCGLRWRIELETEKAMHRAWRKRAEEAEAVHADLRAKLGVKVAEAFDAWNQSADADTTALYAALAAYRAATAGEGQR